MYSDFLWQSEQHKNRFLIFLNQSRSLSYVVLNLIHTVSDVSESDFTLNGRVALNLYCTSVKQDRCHSSAQNNTNAWTTMADTGDGAS